MSLGEIQPKVQFSQSFRPIVLLGQGLDLGLWIKLRVMGCGLGIMLGLWV